MKKAKQIVAVAIIGTVILGTISYEYVMGSSNSETETENTEMANASDGEDTDLTGEGTTQMASDSQYLDFSVSMVRAQIEEVYVSSGSEVEEGDDLFKFTDDTYEALVAYYEEAVADALEAKEDAEEAYTSGVAEAELTYTEDTAESADAQAEYDAAVAEIQEEIDTAYTNLVNAQTSLATYQTNISNNQYYIDAGVADYLSVYEAAKSATETATATYKSAKEAYDGMADTVSAEIESIQSMVSQNSDISEISSELTSAIATLNADNTTLKEYLKVYEDATDNLTACEDAEKTASSEYESAKSTYEKNHSNAEKEVESLTSEIETLQDKYDSLVNAQETSLLELENKYQKALLSGENAQTKYDSTITTLQAAVDEATTEYNNLLEEQEALLSCVNGVVHASQAGTLSSVNVTAEGYLMGDMAVVAYYDTSKIIISTEIDQADISKVNVGDTVSVMITGSGMYEGTITEIATEATSGGSMSNVTYAVTVTIDNSDGALSAGSSAYVTFSYEEEGEEQNENE